MRCWDGYLFEARWKWFANDPADDTAIPSSLASLKSSICGWLETVKEYAIKLVREFVCSLTYTEHWWLPGCDLCRFLIVMSLTAQESSITSTSCNSWQSVATKAGLVLSTGHVPLLLTAWRGLETGDTGHRYIHCHFAMSPSFTVC